MIVMKNNKISSCALVSVPLLFAMAETGFAKDIRKPNVILILADDFCAGDISLMNSGRTTTPTLDSLIRTGLYFSDAYSGSTVSAPSRACILTGLYPHQTGCVTLNLIQFPEFTRIKQGIPTIADIFKSNGYVTGLVGKWHCGIGNGYHPIDRGFDYFTGVSAFNINTYDDYCLNVQRDTIRIKDCYLTDKIGMEAVAFIEKNKDRSFFLHLAHYAPHRPLGAPEEIIAKYEEKGYDRNIATLYAMVEVMDRNIAEMMECLKRNNLLENTIIIFSSDNGPDPVVGERYNLSRKGTKYTVYEGGIKVPFLVSWKDKILPGVTDMRVHFADVLPTLIDMCGLDAEDCKFDGISFFPGINDSIRSQEYSDRYLYWQWNRGVPFYSHNAAVMHGKWKLVRPYVSKQVIIEESALTPALYDIESDPGEQNDLSEQYPEVVRELSVYLENWSRRQEMLRLAD